MASVLPGAPQPEDHQPTEETSEEIGVSSPEQPVEYVLEEEHPIVPAASPEELLPPEARGEANGGPLGCCLGVIVGSLLSLMIAVLSRFYADPLWNMFGHNLSLLVRIVMGVVAVGAAIICGYVGWKIGKLAYKEYDLSPRQKRKLEELERRQLQKRRR